MRKWILTGFTLLLRGLFLGWCKFCLLKPATGAWLNSDVMHDNPPHVWCSTRGLKFSIFYVAYWQIRFETKMRLRWKRNLSHRTRQQTNTNQFIFPKRFFLFYMQISSSFRLFYVIFTTVDHISIRMNIKEEKKIPFPQINVHTTLWAHFDNPLVTNSFSPFCLPLVCFIFDPSSRRSPEDWYGKMENS